MVYMDKYGWPVVLVKGSPILNFIRILLHAESLMSHGRGEELGAARISPMPMKAYLKMVGDGGK